MMGKRGPKPKPTALKVLQGNPGQRKLPGIVEAPAGEMPDAPEHLSLDEMHVWNQYAPIAHAMGLLTPADAERFAELCEAVAAARRMKQMALYQEIYKAESGYTQATAYVTEWRKWRAEARKIGALFGLDPSSRASISTGNPPDEFDELELMVM